MSLLDRNHLLGYVKWLAFLFCTVGFVWKMSDSFITYMCREIGTKTDLKANYEADLPGLAVCRHPNQIATLWDKGHNISLTNTYNLTLAHLRFLTAYRANSDLSLDPILDQFLFNDSSCIRGVTISSRGLYSRVSLPTLVSKPASRPQEWTTSFHPIYGICYNFSPSEGGVSEFVGTAGIDYMKISVNFKTAFPDFDSTITNATMEDNTKNIQNEYGQNTVLVVVYDKGSFLTSNQAALLEKSVDEQFTLQQEVVDKSNTKSIFKCRDYNVEDGVTEDNCLNECLVMTFVEEFGCLHARLRLMEFKNETAKAMPSCTLEHLEIKTNEYSDFLNTNARPHKNPRARAVEEFGLIRIRQILASFNQEDLDGRCGCAVPCHRTVITITKWPSQRPKDRSKFAGYNHNFALFQFQPYLKVYCYHLLYTGSDLVADIGGYLGLFLGLSAFGLVELLEKAILESKTKEEGDQQLEAVDTTEDHKNTAAAVEQKEIENSLS